jgi:hypothetical protein
MPLISKMRRRPSFVPPVDQGAVRASKVTMPLWRNCPSRLTGVTASPCAATARARTGPSPSRGLADDLAADFMTRFESSSIHPSRELERILAVRGREDPAVLVERDRLHPRGADSEAHGAPLFTTTQKTQTAFVFMGGVLSSYRG